MPADRLHIHDSADPSTAPDPTWLDGAAHDAHCPHSRESCKKYHQRATTHKGLIAIVIQRRIIGPDRILRLHEQRGRISIWSFLKYSVFNLFLWNGTF
jgi:hypothetical protein